MSNASDLTNTFNEFTTVRGIKLLHKRYAGSEWNNHVLYKGEFGIDSNSGEVRGYIKYENNSPDICTWNEATIIGQVSISIENETSTPEDRAYVYGIATVTDDSTGTVSYELKRATLPEVTVNNTTSGLDNEQLNTVAGRVVTSISKQDTDTISYTEGYIPGATFNTDGNDGYVSGIVPVEGTYNTFQVKHEPIPSLAGTQVDYATNDTTIVGGISFAGHNIEAKVKKIIAKSDSTIEVSQDATSGNIIIGIDDSKYAKADITGAMTFKGTIDISDSTQVQLEGTDESGNPLYDWSEGFAYKIIQTAINSNQITTSTLQIHLSDGTYVSSADVKAGDLLVAVNNNDGRHICLIPSGDETNGTVTQITAGTGLKTDTGENKTIVSTGTIYHQAAERHYSPTNTNTTLNTYVGCAPKIKSDTQYDNSNLNNPEENTEVYDVINYVEVDKENLGHVTDIRKTQLKILSEESITKIAKKHGPTLDEGDLIKITKTESTEENGTVTPAVYTVSHDIATETDSTQGSSDDNIVIKKIQLDKYKHVVGVETVNISGAFEDTNSWRPIQVNGNNFLNEKTESGSVNFNQGNHITINNDSNGTITISDNIGQATDETQGLVKSTYTTDTDVAVQDVSSVDSKMYGTTIDTTGKLSVQVPDHIVNNAANLADSGLQFCAIQRDKYGHVIAISTIDVIDGNDVQ